MRIWHGCLQRKSIAGCNRGNSSSSRNPRWKKTKLWQPYCSRKSKAELSIWVMLNWHPCCTKKNCCSKRRSLQHSENEKK
jgi:hypothetical protein